MRGVAISSSEELSSSSARSPRRYAPRDDKLGTHERLSRTYRTVKATRADIERMSARLRAKIASSHGLAKARVTMTDIMPGQRVGEVMVSHSQRIEAQCYELHGSPPLGALLRVGSPPVYAVVREIWHEPLDPSRPLAPRGSSLESEDEIYAANPQLSAMLTTRFSATVIGYGDGPTVQFGLPAQPPNLHAFIFTCDTGETTAFASDLGWARLFLADVSPAADSALIGFLRQAAVSMADRTGFMLRAGRALAAELSHDPQRLQAMLREMTA